MIRKCGVETNDLAYIHFPPSLNAACVLGVTLQHAVIRHPGLCDIHSERRLFAGARAGVRHSIGGADYASVRAGAFMGLRIMTQLKAVEGPDPLGQPDLLPMHAQIWNKIAGMHTLEIVSWQWTQVHALQSGRECVHQHATIACNRISCTASAQPRWANTVVSVLGGTL